MKIKNRFQKTQEYIEKWELENNNKMVLDAGAGSRPYKKIFKKNQYISQDFGEYKGGGNTAYWDQEAEKRWQGENADILSDITEIPLDQNTCDLIICTEVLEHVYNPVEALKELTRLLRQDGNIVISVPYACHYHQEPYFFNCGLSTHFFKKFAEENGLIVKLIDTEGDYVDFLSFENYVLQRMQKEKIKRVLMLPAIILSRYQKFIHRLIGLDQPKLHSGIFCVLGKGAR